MKKFIPIVLLSLGIMTQSFGQKVNEKVQVEHNGSWYDATILKVNAADGLYFITYDGWSDSWDEWVPPSRLKGFEQAAAPAETTKSPLTKFKVGDKVEVEYGMIPAPAKVIEVGENKYHIEFDNKLYKTKWVTEREITKL